MFYKADVDKLMDFALVLTKEYGTSYDDLLEKWGVETSLSAMENIWKAPPMDADAFLKSWFQMLHHNLESAIWLTVYNHSRLTSMTQKDAMKLADEILRRYQKGEPA